MSEPIVVYTKFMKTDRVEIGSILSNIKFWRKFSRYLLIGISAFVLLLAQQNNSFLALAQNPNPIPIPPPPPPPAVSCPDDLRYCDTNINKIVYKHGGYWDGTQCIYAFDQEGACNVPAPVSCPDDLRYCDTNVNKIVHKFGGVPDAS